MIKELEIKCQSCNIVLLTYTNFTFYRRHYLDLKLFPQRKFHKHHRAGHKISKIIYHIYDTDLGQIRINPDDKITCFLLDSKSVIIP